MSPDSAVLIRYWQDLARGTLQDAQALHERESLQSAVNRAYYACFYAVLALLKTKDLSATKVRESSRCSSNILSRLAS
ncbi:MAG: HEPN domain-containing protein [Candidatus Hydrogenedentes bacterium]|nr:HEPN domain-containing protein [Candidatus Hydrogenedentota bacterium]